MRVICAVHKVDDVVLLSVLLSLPVGSSTLSELFFHTFIIYNLQNLQ
jgi:hypothetical protein